MKTFHLFSLSKICAAQTEAPLEELFSSIDVSSSILIRDVGNQIKVANLKLKGARTYFITGVRNCTRQP